jgi:hypothetical protein
MDRRKLLLIALLLLVVAVTGGGVWRLLALGKLTGGYGPQALSRDGNGGIYLATDHELLHLDGSGKVLARHSVESLGLFEINALALGEDHTLYVYDSRQRRLYRCDTRRWGCAAFGARNLGLDENVQIAWLYGPDRRLLLADNTHHRVLAFAADGTSIGSSATVWHFPNQVVASGEHVLLADTDTRRIVTLDATGNGMVGVALQARERPYRFARRDAEWWVLEAGVTLERARLRYYRSGEATEIALPAADPVALLDIGRALIVISKEDWRLLAVDPDTNAVTRFGAPELQEEFRLRHASTLEARRERAQLPLLMAGLMLPALFGGVLLQRRIDRDARTALPPADTPARPATAPAGAPAAPLAAAGQPARRTAAVRIDTDRDALAMARALQNRQLLRASLLLVPMLLLLPLVLWLLLPDTSALKFLVPLFLAVPLLLGLALYSGRRQQDRLYDQHFLLGPDKLIHVVRGKPLRAVPYAAIWLGEESLILGKRRLPLYIGFGAQRSALWNIGDVQRELGARIPHTQHLGEVELARAMLAQGRVVGLQVLSARFLIIIVVVLLVLLKLWNLLHHSLGWTLWEIFH